MVLGVVWSKDLLDGNTALQSLVDGHVCRLVEFLGHKLQPSQSQLMDAVVELCDSVTMVTNSSSPAGTVPRKLHMVEVFSGGPMPYTLRCALRALEKMVTAQAAYQDKVMVGRYETEQFYADGSFCVDLAGLACPCGDLLIAQPDVLRLLEQLVPVAAFLHNS